MDVLNVISISLMALAIVFVIWQVVRDDNNGED